MQTFKINFFTKNSLTSEIVTAVDEDAAVQQLLASDVLKNLLQVLSVEVHDVDYDDTYEPDLYPNEDKALPKFFEPFCPSGAAMLNVANMQNPHLHLDEKVSQSFQGETIYDMEDNHRKVGFVLCGLFAPNLNCDDYRFEYTLVSSSTLKDYGLKMDQALLLKMDVTEYFSWLEDTRKHPVFLVKDGNSLKVQEGQDRLNAFFCCNIDNDFVAAVIAHKI